MVSGCGQTALFRQDGLWHYNGLAVRRMADLPLLVVESDRASERCAVAFYIK